LAEAMILCEELRKLGIEAFFEGQYLTKYGRNKPDFHLPQHDLFIEHWALNKKVKFQHSSIITTKNIKMGLKKRENGSRNIINCLLKPIPTNITLIDLKSSIELLKTRIQKKNGKSF
jgi:hypothetical protein